MVRKIQVERPKSEIITGNKRYKVNVFFDWHSKIHEAKPTKAELTDKERQRKLSEEVKKIYIELLNKLPPPLRKDAPALVISNKRYVRNIGHYDAINNVIRVTNDITRYDADKIKHVLAHELSHYILYKCNHDKYLNMIHDTMFYKTLAWLIGYKSWEEASEKDNMISSTNAITKEKPERKVEFKTLNIDIKPKVKLKSEKAFFLDVTMKTLSRKSIERLEEIISKMQTLGLSSCSSISANGQLKLSCILTIYYSRQNPIYKQLFKLEELLKDLVKNDTNILAIDVWRTTGTAIKYEIKI